MGQQDLPGFYYDPEKHRYFPLKGPIPGTRSTPKNNVATRPTLDRKVTKRTRSLNKLLGSRELNANPVSNRELLAFLFCDPAVWKYNTGPLSADVGLEMSSLNCQTASGVRTIPFLLAANSQGDFSLLQVGDGYQTRRKYVPDCIHLSKRDTELCPLLISRIRPAPFSISHGLSSLVLSKSGGNESGHVNYALLSTLGSASCGGALSLLNFSDPFDYSSRNPPIKRITSIVGTCWTAACSPDAARAAIGANNGAALVDLESGDKSWMLRCDSDVFAQQFDPSGNVVLCGLRNGAIVTVDVREKFRKYIVDSSNRRVRLWSGCQKDSRLRRQTFELKGKMQPRTTNFMPSSVCSLKIFLSDDCYFVASSMDGSISLFDHRKAAAVQTYDGNVNSHSLIRVGVDPSEKFVISGGEDKRMRIWSINSGDLVAEREISDIPMTVSWESWSGCASGSLTWFGSREGIYCMQWR